MQQVTDKAILREYDADELYQYYIDNLHNLNISLLNYIKNLYFQLTKKELINNEKT